MLNWVKHNKNIITSGPELNPEIPKAVQRYPIISIIHPRVSRFAKGIGGGNN